MITEDEKKIIQEMIFRSVLVPIDWKNPEAEMLCQQLIDVTERVQELIGDKK